MDCDVLIVGAGIAGASIAANIAGAVSTMVIEAEDFAGFHSTGRSAAFYDESYGGPGVQPLTSASGPMLAQGQRDMDGRSFLRPRGGVILAHGDNIGALAAMQAQFAGTQVALTPMDGAELHRRVPGLRAAWANALRQPHCQDIDVGALHQSMLKRAKMGGATQVNRAALVRATRLAGGGWRVETEAGIIHAARIVNAAGAWADDVAARCGAAPIGITPYRRTVVQLRLHQPVPAELPLCIDAGGSFYVKGEGEGRVWLSPHDETPDTARDVAAEEQDVAIAIDRLGQVVDWDVAAVERKWAGLRSFAPDRLPVYGYDAHCPDFFWCAGQGGFGIQTAPAAGLLAGAALLGHAPDAAVGAIDFARYAPHRFG
ncbi:MAG: NAD(P)/FAD-dependent oxidoreductase [Sphingopyxis sp.]